MSPPSQPSALLVRRLVRCAHVPASSFSSSSPTAAVTPPNKKNRLVFMGSPQVSAMVLDRLLDAAVTPGSDFEVAAIVTQPPSRRERGRRLMPSPVGQKALDRGFPSDLIFAPEGAGEEPFLSDIKALNPGLCVTAAYGNILPCKFLEIPLLGTVNIHPSLLPLYRGAAPVQRALQDGVKETGVSLAYTVLALDAGPIIANEKMEIDEYIKGPDLLKSLFDIGSRLLLRELSAIFDGSAKSKAQAQDDSKATMALKLTSDESWLSFDEEAFILHNKVRAFAGWPGTRAKIQMSGDGHANVVEVKIISTRLCGPRSFDGDGHVIISGDALVFPCAKGTALEVLEIQLPGKKVMSARDFWNGARGLKLKILP